MVRVGHFPLNHCAGVAGVERWNQIYQLYKDGRKNLT